MQNTLTRRHVLIEHSKAEHARTVLVDWMLGNSCSYACSYCPKDLHSGSEGWQKAAAIIAFYDQLHRHYMHHRGRQVWLQFTGGEPTMHPHIIKILEAASARDFKVSLISNASRTTRFWTKITPYLDSVILTYHSEFAKLPHFMEVAKIVSAEMAVHMNITMSPDRFDQILADAHALREAFPMATISLKALRKGFGAEMFDYTDPQLDVMRAGLPNATLVDLTTPRGAMVAVHSDGTEEECRANELVVNGENHWLGYQCNAGLESLRVSGTGEITRAVCAVGGVIGHLGEDIAMPTSSIKCTAKSCACLADILITKFQTPSAPERQDYRTT